MLAETDAQYQALRARPGKTPPAHGGLRRRRQHGCWTRPSRCRPTPRSWWRPSWPTSTPPRASCPRPSSPACEFGEDYTQYIPRGHYTLSDELRRYFKSMMWYGRMTFRLKTTRSRSRPGRDALRPAAGAGPAHSRGERRPALDAWLDLYNPTVFFVGRSDDLTACSTSRCIDAVYGPTPLEPIADDGKLDAFIELARRAAAAARSWAWSSRRRTTTTRKPDDQGLSLHGPALCARRLHLPPAHLPQRRHPQTSRRMLPKGLDLMAAMGSERAYTLLDEMGETATKTTRSRWPRCRPGSAA
jgi:hypothetical protein